MPEKRLGHLFWISLLAIALLVLGASWLTFGGDRSEAFRRLGLSLPFEGTGEDILSRLSSEMNPPAVASNGRTSTKNRKIPPLSSPNYLRTSGSRIVDSQGNEVRLTGVNWFGMETATFAPHGLWSRNWEDMLDQIVDLGFNTIRLPYSNEMFDKNSEPNGIGWELNPDLKGLKPIEIMDKIVVGAGERGLKVILDRHRPDSSSQSNLWHTSRYSEQRWIDDWKMLAARYAGNDTVIAADLHNEPKGEATWGSGDSNTDWRLAAERAGNAILSVNPNLLIIVEGIDQYKGNWYWWGGNLMGAKDFPVRLKSPDKLVYSAHDYGAGVHMQAWFTDKTFPANLPKVWHDNWYYLVKEGIAPVYIGEFGGRSVGSDTEGMWQRAIARFLKENGLSYTYWSLNPNSGDTGGILDDDWETPLGEKMAVLSEHQAPLIKNGSPLKVNGTNQTSSAPRPQPTVESGVTSAQPSPTTASGKPAGLRIAFHSARYEEKTSDLGLELRIENKGPAPVELRDMELRYWFVAENLGSKRQIFSVDWASIDSGALRAEFLPMPLAGQTHFLRLTFEDRAGSLVSGRTLEIKARIRKEDWSEYNQSNDYSFSRSKDFVEWDHVTAYVKGQLVWGLEPCGNPAS